MSRRLAVETLESRVLLSGTELDYSIWNLDSIQDNYAVISQGGALPPPSWSTDSAASPAAAQLNVDWVAVPGMTVPRDLPNVEPTLNPSGTDHGTAVAGLVEAGTSTAYLDSLVSNGAGYSVDGSITSALDINIYRDSLHSSRYTIAVGGVDHDETYFNSDGTLTNYFDAGSSVLVAAPTGSLDVLPAWDLGTGAGVMVGIVDSGVQVQHPDLYDSLSYTSRFNGTSSSELIDSPWIQLVLDAAGADADYEVASADGPLSFDESEGGEIPIQTLVSTLDNAPALAARAEQRAAAENAAGEASAALRAADTTSALADAGISGELARAIAFEVIDGEAVPVVYTAGRHAEHAVAYTPVDGDAKLAESGLRKLAVPSGLASRVRPTAYERVVADETDVARAAAAWSGRSDGLGFNEVTPAAADVARSELFARWEQRDSDGDLASTAAEDHEPKLAAIPLLAVLAVELIMAGRIKRGEQSARPTKAARGESLPL